MFFRGDLVFTTDQGNDPDDQENEEKNFCDVGSSASDNSKAENCGDDCDDEEDKGPMEHGFGELMVLFPARTPRRMNPT